MLNRLTRINTDDLLKSFQLDRYPRARSMFEALAWLPARRFARQVMTCDQIVGTDGLGAGGAWMVRQFARRLEVSGAEHIPRTGPVFIFANHPGTVDTTALFAAIPRTDLRVVAADRPFLEALPNTSRYLLTLAEQAPSRTRLVRAVVAHLRLGGAVLNFPAGKIEPDPAIMPDAVSRLAEWSASCALFVRLAPAAVVVPAVVSGVISAAALRNPITRLYQTRRDREWVGATLQVLFSAYRLPVVRVQFGEPIAGADLLTAGDADAITSVITGRVAQLMTRSTSNH